MGFLTPMFIYNDAIHNLKNDDGTFSKLIYDSASEAVHHKIPIDFNLGSLANGATVFPSRHADHATVYVLQGNTMVEMNADTKDVKRIMNNNPKFYKEMIKTMKQAIKELDIEYNKILVQKVTGKAK